MGSNYFFRDGRNWEKHGKNRPSEETANPVGTYSLAKANSEIS